MVRPNRVARSGQRLGGQERRDGPAHVPGYDRIEPLTGPATHRDGMAGALKGHPPVAALAHHGRDRAGHAQPGAGPFAVRAGS